MNAFETLAPEHRTVLRDILTSRQQEVLNLITAGYGQREAAQKLNLSRGTIRDHIRAALRNLDEHPDTLNAVTAAAKPSRYNPRRQWH